MKIKRLVSVVLAAAMSLSLMSALPITVSAASSDNKNVSAARIWNGKADTSWYTGDKDSYDISTAEELAGFAQLVDEAAHDDRFRGVTINLTNDIILNDTTNWKDWEEKPPKNEWNPIGKVGSPVSGYMPFAGVFNGNGHTISGMYVNSVTPDELFARAEPGGLFTYISGAVICNLKLEKGVVIGEETVGGLTGLSENSYVDSVDVSNFIVQAKNGNVAGGLIGEAGRVNMTLMMFNAALLGAGFLVNPLVFSGNEGADLIRASYINNCKSTNVTLYTDAWSPIAGGIVGQIFRGGIYNSLSVNTTFSSKCDYRRDWANYGAILGAEEYQGECTLENCYTYNYKVEDSAKASKKLVRSDKERVKAITKKSLNSSKFAKKLGKGFKYVKGSSPRITSINVPKVYVTLSGEYATFTWNKVKGAKEYKIYYKSGSKYELLSTTTKPKEVLAPIAEGYTYDFLIRSFDGKGNHTDITGGAFKFTA